MAQDSAPSLLSDNAEERVLASKQLFELITKRKEEAVKILANSPVSDQPLDPTSPVLVAIDVIGRLRALDSIEFILKHVASVYIPQGALSETRLDYVGMRPAVRVIASLGPAVLPKCIEKIEVTDNPNVACILIAMSEAAGSRVAAKKSVQDRLSVSQSKDVQLRLRKLLADFDKIVTKELDSSAMKPITAKPEWEQTGN